MDITTEHGALSRDAEGEKVKILRAYGGCLGAKSRRRTRSTAKSFGEPQAGFDPEISEWGNPAGAISRHPMVNKIVIGRQPAELKHLSKRRKRKKNRFPK